MSQARRIALFPASFDPVTNGHLDIARTPRMIATAPTSRA